MGGGTCHSPGRLSIANAKVGGLAGGSWGPKNTAGITLKLRSL